MKPAFKVIIAYLIISVQQDDILCRTLFQFDSQYISLVNYFGDMVFNLSKEYMYAKKVIMILLPKNHDPSMLVILENVIKKLSLWTVIVYDSYCCETIEEVSFSYNKVVEKLDFPEMYIIPIHHSERVGFLESQLWKFKEFDSFNPRAIFILVKFTENCGLVDENSALNANIFNVMWNQNLFAATLFILSECDHHLTVVSARPFSTQNECRRIGYNGMKSYRYSTNDRKMNVSLVYNEPRDLRGCTFIAGTAPIPPFVVGKPTKIHNKTHYEYVGGIDIEMM
jgi:hypothetical protein